MSREAPKGACERACWNRDPAIRRSLREPPAFTGVEPSQPSIRRLVPTLKAGSLAVLASRTTIGKTAWAVDLARHALTQQVPVLYCSGREPKHDIGIRFLAGILGIDNTDPLSGQISAEVFQQLDRARDMLSELPLDILDHPRDMFGDLQERLASGRRGLVVIDDIDALVDPTELQKEGAEPTAQQLTCLASHWQVSMLALTQLDQVPDAEYRRPPAVVRPGSAPTPGWPCRDRDPAAPSRLLRPQGPPWPTPGPRGQERHRPDR